MRPHAPTIAVALALLAAPPAGRADDPDDLVTGRILLLKPARAVKFVALPPTGTSFDLPDAGNEPTAGGGAVRILDTVPPGAGDETYALPALGWYPLGTPPGANGFKYRGSGEPGDPCRLLLLKPNVLKGLCKGDEIGLVPPFTGEVAIVVAVGTAPKRYCASFGGVTSYNEAFGVKRRKAPAPAACPE
jgi:hypothetical protein